MVQSSTVTAASTADAFSPETLLVAIPTLNEEAAIANCVESLIGEDPCMRDVTFVVADGGSTDKTLSRIADLQNRFPNLHVMRNHARLQSAGINSVVAEYVMPNHQYLVRCDAHATYPPGYLKAVVKSLATLPEAASVVVSMDSVGSGCFSKAAAWIVDTKLGSGGSAHRGGTASQWVEHGHHAGFKLDWFRRVEGYDPSFSHNEDAEYDFRINKAGGKIWLDADIRLDYKMRDSLKKLAKQYWLYGRGRARTIKKHRMKPRLRQMIPVLHTLILVSTGLLALIWPLMLIYPAIYVATLCLVSFTGFVKLAKPCGLWAGPALGAMHISWAAGFLQQIFMSKI